LTTAKAELLDDARLDDTFAALANSTRRAILAQLAGGEASVNDLAAPFDLTLPAISKHIKVLEHAGLITRTRRAQFRPCTLDPGPLAEVADWAEQYRHIWDDRFDRMDDYVRDLQQPVGSPGGPDDLHSSNHRQRSNNTESDTNDD